MVLESRDLPSGTESEGPTAKCHSQLHRSLRGAPWPTAIAIVVCGEGLVVVGDQDDMTTEQRTIERRPGRPDKGAKSDSLRLMVDETLFIRTCQLHDIVAKQ